MARRNNNMTLFSGVALLVLGAFLLGWGYSVGRSWSSKFNEFLTGVPVEEVRLMYLGGAVAIVIGLIQVFRAR